MKKYRLLPAIFMLVLCLAALCVGVYALRPKKSNVQGTISIQASNVEAEITAYLGIGKTTKISDTISTRGNATLDIYENVLSFNGEGKSQASDVESITMVIEIKNKSTERDLGAFFYDGWLPQTVTNNNITTLMNFNGASEDGKVLTANLIQADLQGYTKVGKNETINLTCEFSLKKLADVGMCVNFNLPLVLHEYTESLVSTQYWNTDGALKILSIGNSFTVDTQEYVYQIANSLGIDNIELGSLVIDNATLATHATNAQSDTAAYSYYTNTTGTWSVANNYKISTAVTSTNWDYITFEQASGNSGQASTYDNLTTLLSKIKTLNNTASYVWNMTWAYQQTSTNSAFVNYGNNQITMFESIVNAVQTKIDTNADIDRVIPVGTAIQNARSSIIGDTLTRDGQNLTYGIGRYIAGLCFVKSLTGIRIDDVSFVPSGNYAIPQTYKDIAVLATNSALVRPYSITTLGEGLTWYVGYDGYIWSGAYRTTYKADNYVIAEDVIENTIGIEGEMSKYFEGGYLNLSNSTVALMAYYMPNAKLTLYSGIGVNSIKIVAQQAGQLYIGTAKVADVVNARTNGTAYTTLNSGVYTVKAGLNEINLGGLLVAEDETVVLGGQGSVGLYYAKGIPIDDEHGNFTILDNQSHESVISNTNGMADTLDIQITVSAGNISYSSIIEEDYVENSSISTLANANTTGGYTPYVLGNYTAFENKRIGKIGLAIKSVKAIDDNQKFTIYLVNVSDFETELVRKDPYTITIPQSELEGATYNSAQGVYVVNKWVYVDVTDLNLTVGAGQTLGFCGEGDDVTIGYSNTGNKTNINHSFYLNSHNINQSISKGYLLQVDVQQLNGKIFNFEEHIKDLNEKEQLAINS